MSPATATRELSNALDGEVTLPGDPGYDDARSLYNAMIDKRPAVIARCAIRRRRRGRPRVRAHVDLAACGPRRRPQRSGLRNRRGRRRHRPVADERASRSTPDARTARVARRRDWGQVDAATHAFGLATPTGIISTTGVGGLTLGGGHRLPVPQVRPDDRQPAGGRGGAGRRARGDRQRDRSTPTCSGRCAVAAATSAWSPRSRSACIRCTR